MIASFIDLHFGVGAARTVDVAVKWPNGDEQRFSGLATDRAYTISQASGLKGRTAARAP